MGLSTVLKALWYEAKGNWQHAHELVMDDERGDGAWVHAYLHRKEGDQWNAEYWYKRARKPVYHGALDQEWEDLVVELL